MEKKNLIILTVLLLMVLFNGAALGAYSTYRCVIDQVGMKGGEVRVQLSEVSGKFDKKWFCCTRDVSKEMLAILLTASANDMVVRIRTDLQKGPEPEIVNSFILP